MQNDRLTDLEIQLTHQTKMLEDLSDVVARQSKEIDRLTRRLHIVMERLAEHDLAAGATAPLADQKPPHW